MTTDAQKKANARNAEKSTGPRTAQGKLHSSQNALKHGGFAQRNLPIPRGVFQEDPDEVAEFLVGIVDSLGPRDAVERALADYIAGCYLRLTRVGRFEAEAIAGTEKPLTGPQNPDNPRSVEYHEEQLARDRGSRANILFEYTLLRTSRVDSRNNLSLERAMKQYAKLQERDLGDSHAA